MNGRDLKLRPANASDIDDVNALIEAAIMTWDLPERVKRLALSSYLYHAHDLDHLELMVAEASDGIVGVAAWERADPADVPAGRTALLLHGIHVLPRRHRGGIGTALVKAAMDQVRGRGFDGLLVKAQPGAEDFFLALGMETLPVEDPRRDYPYRFWMPAAD